jgi:hypothetical protein
MSRLFVQLRTIPRFRIFRQGGSPGSPVGVEPLDQHGPEPVHDLGTQATRLLDLSGELYGKHVGLEAHPAFLTLLDLAVQFIDEILRDRVFQVLLKEG